MSFQDVPAHRIDDLIRDGYQLIDVREPFEFAQMAHPRAMNIPLAHLSDRVRELDRSRPVAVVCQSGNRSSAAASTLVKYGFSRVANINGGMTAVRRLGRI